MKKLSIIELYEKFNSMIELQGDCWIWKGRINKDGYASFTTRIEGKYCNRANRFSMYIFDKHFSFYSELFVCHKCDNPKCVNPNCLFLSTTQGNMDDMVHKGRSCRGIKQRSCKLDNKKVLELRRIANLHLHTRKELAIIFGINKSVVTKIINRQLWKHI